MSAPVIIVGSGLAGYNLAREFRKANRETPLVVISRDAAGFYSKPMLSNALASGKTPNSLVMKTAEKMAEELQADIRAHSQVRQIDPKSQTLTLSDGNTLIYRDLVLALGADPIAPGLEGDALDRVVSVNDLDDYARFSELLNGAQRVAILGAGLIGCEFANDLLKRNITPIVIDPGQGPLSRLLPPEARERLQEKLQQAGAQFMWGRTAKQVSRGANQLQVTLSDGEVIEADLVLSAIGLRPRIGMAQSAGLSVGRGIITDARLATSAPHIYAIGDCAEVCGHNLPYVMPLMNQARALAATLNGQATDVAYPAMPVTVKTPACPTVVCPPSPQALGQWQVETQEDSLVARFVGDDQQLLGFALMGGAVSQRQALSGQIKPLW